MLYLLFESSNQRHLTLDTDISNMHEAGLHYQPNVIFQFIQHSVNGFSIHRLTSNQKYCYKTHKLVFIGYCSKFIFVLCIRYLLFIDIRCQLKNKRFLKNLFP